MREEVRNIQELLRRQTYVSDAAVATSLYLAMALGKPLLIEGPAGVGKTEIAKSLSLSLDARLVRLQCYEGLDATTAIYEWNYPKQLLRIKLQETAVSSAAENDFSHHFSSFGGHVLLTPDLELGLRFGFGLNDQSAKFFNNVGIAWRF